MNKLFVYLHEKHVGVLHRNANGSYSFDYELTWLEDPNAISLSQSLPLINTTFSHRQCQGYFNGLLPEGENRIRLERLLRLNTGDINLLELLGRECAGAVSIRNELFEPSAPHRSLTYETITAELMPDILVEIASRPLLAGKNNIRLSLAGAQDKAGVYVKGSTISLAIAGAFTTHILKPDHYRYTGLVHNEDLCMKLAATVGLSVANTEVHTAGASEYILIERFDRRMDAAGHIHDVHQEDFCQAMEITSERKYPGDGGPGLKQCFELLETVSTNPKADKFDFMSAVIFNFLIGNNDAHGKNFSLLYDNGETRLAPLYDLIATEIYPDLTKKMAMHIMRHKEFKEIVPRHFRRLAEIVGLNPDIVCSRLEQLAAEIKEALRYLDTEHPHRLEVSRFIDKGVIQC